jgi:cell division protein FtsA
MREKIISAIDIGSYKICACCATVDSSGLVHVKASTVIPSEGVLAGKIINKNKASKCVREAVKRLRSLSGLKASRFFVNIDTVCTRAKICYEPILECDPGSIRKSQLQRIIHSAISSNITLGRKVIYADIADSPNQPGGDKDCEVKVGVFSVLIPSMKQFANMIHESGIQIQGLIPSGYAQALSFFKGNEAQSAIRRIILDFGARTTKLTLLEGAMVKKIRTITRGAQSITDDIAVKLKVSPEDAEKVKLKCAKVSQAQIQTNQRIVLSEKDPSKTVSPLELYDVVSSKADELLQEVKRVLFEFTGEEGFNYQLCDEMIVTGGGAMLEGFLEHAEKILEVPLKLGFIYSVDSSRLQARSAVYATTIGLVRFGSLLQSRSNKSYSAVDLRPLSRAASRAKELYYEYF